MLLCFWIVVLCTFFSIIYIIAKTYFSKTYKVFYDKKHISFNIVESLAKMIENKIFNLPKVEFVIDYDSFLSMNLIFAPLYLVDKMKLGANHLKLYEQALEIVDFPINFVVLNGSVRVQNSKVNVISLNKYELNAKQIATLNILNVNTPIKNREKIQLFEDAKSVQFHFDFETLSSFGEMKKGEKYLINLPRPYYNFLFKGKRNSVEVCDIFGRKVADIVGNFSSLIKNGYLYVCASKNSVLSMTPNFVDREKEILNLFNFEILADKFSSEISILKENALNEISHNVFALQGQLNKLNVQDLKTFFKVCTMRKSYLNDYLYLLKEIFGIKISNNVLTVNPSEIVDFDFAIKYVIDDVDYLVRYSHISGEKVKLNYAGHKIGHKDDYVFGF